MRDRRRDQQRAAPVRPRARSRARRRSSRTNSRPATPATLWSGRASTRARPAASSTSPTPLSKRPVLAPTPRKLKRNVANRVTQRDTVHGVDARRRACCRRTADEDGRSRSRARPPRVVRSRLQLTCRRRNHHRCEPVIGVGICAGVKGTLPRRARSVQVKSRNRVLNLCERPQYACAPIPVGSLRER